MLPVLLSALPQQNRLQTGLSAPRANLQPHVWWQWQQMDPASIGASWLAILVPGKGRHRVLYDTHLKREPHCLHVCALLTERPLHFTVLSWECGWLGTDEQLLHRPGFTHQLQHLLLRLFWLWSQFWKTIREEPVCRCGSCMACTQVKVSRATETSLGHLKKKIGYEVIKNKQKIGE